MKYRGFINKSRTHDLAALNTMVDAALPVLMAYSPEQLGITVGAYFAVRMVLNMAQAWLRYHTTGPIGQKDVE